jgi:hypothetical protein
MANPKYPAPVRSVEEQTKHDWVQIDVKWTPEIGPNVKV